MWVVELVSVVWIAWIWFLPGSFTLQCTFACPQHLQSNSHISWLDGIIEDCFLWNWSDSNWSSNSSSMCMHVSSDDFSLILVVTCNGSSFFLCTMSTASRCMSSPVAPAAFDVILFSSFFLLLFLWHTCSRCTQGNPVGVLSQPSVSAACHCLDSLQPSFLWTCTSSSSGVAPAMHLPRPQSLACGQFPQDSHREVPLKGLQINPQPFKGGSELVCAGLHGRSD